MPSGRRLAPEFYARGTLTVARELIGLHLVRMFRGRRLVGRIVETEAYKGPRDLAAHSSRGRTARTETMFGPPGHAYVYFIYGVWHCVNVVTGSVGTPHAVLLRAVEPIEGITGKTSGPGLLCRAMRIDRRLNGADLCASPLWVEQPHSSVWRRPRIGRTARIGVDYAGAWADKPWRFLDRDSPCVSGRPAGRRCASISRF